MPYKMMKKILTMFIIVLILFGSLLADNKCKKKFSLDKKIIICSLAYYFTDSFYFIDNFSTGIYQIQNPRASFLRDEIKIRRTPRECRDLKMNCYAMGGKFEKHGDVKYDDYYCSCLH